MASSVASRTSRPHQHVDSEDAVMVRAIAFATWARKNAQVILGVTAAAIVAAGVLLYLRYDRAGREGRASAEFLSVAATARAGGNETLAARDLENFTHRFDGTVEADEARVMLGQIKMKGNQPRAAIPLFQEVADGSSPLRVQGLTLLGAAQAAAGDMNAAVASYQKAAETAKLPFEKASALSDLAALYEQKGDYKSAAATWGQLVETAEKGTPERAEYEMRQAEAQANAPGAK
ncbi:MAG TPA: tetratricopeptide repeat protein [Longimicrobiaceae bacterium]|nr:tetratricopeptide repeat protein [Longimicrobiaceae bacterium]